MADTYNLRELALGILMEVTEEETYIHIALGNTLSKYQYLQKRDRSFLSRVTEGTLENLIQIDYIIESFSRVPIYNMKPLIRNLLRMSIYQLKFMDSVPDRAVVNEAVRIAQKRGFYNLKGFVNGVLRAAARDMDRVVYPDARNDPVGFLSVVYSMPQWIIYKWLDQFSFDIVKNVCASFQKRRPTTVRMRTGYISKEEITESLRSEGVTVREHPFIEYALDISGYNYLQSLAAFRNGWIYVQDASSMLVTEVAAPNWGDYCIDVCASPGGKSLHLADKLRGSGYVEARDRSEEKVERIQENINRLGVINMIAALKDATVFDKEEFQKADIVLCDVPCSGLGVIGKKQDIRYRISEDRIKELVQIQRRILSVSQNYVKKGGVLVYSTCTIGTEENQMNLKYFLENFPFHLDSINPYIPDVLKCRTSAGGFLQLLPGINDCDGFFIARLRRYD